jgi:MULE transposase domain
MKMLAQHDIAGPKCFVTDRELTLLNVLDKLFPASDRILCRWHVNIGRKVWLLSGNIGDLGRV